MSHKTHSITTRYRNYDIEDALATKDSAFLGLVPPDHTMPEGDNESSKEYSQKLTLTIPWLIC